MRTPQNRHLQVRTLLGAMFLSLTAACVDEPAGDTRVPPRPGSPVVDTITFSSGDLSLKGVIWRPPGDGPHPAVLFNHGSGQDYTDQIAALGPVFVARGYIMFWPYRRGHGLSADQGKWVGEQLDAAEAEGGVELWSSVMTDLLRGPHLADQTAALDWLMAQPEVDTTRVYVAGNSFGGIQTVLMAAQTDRVRAAVDFAGAALTWARSPDLRAAMTEAAAGAHVPLMFVQAENDADTSPSRELATAMEEAGKLYRIHIFPRFGETEQDGHSFGYFGAEIWGDTVFSFFEEYAPKRSN